MDEAVRPFFDSFVARLPRQVGRLQQLIARGELDQAREIVHNLKGTGGLYGLMPITEKAAEAEQRIESRAALESIIEQVDELIATVRSVEGYDPSREAARGEA
ncbi:MAG: Hpt domain-containing protein [Phycisphaeraceae bacterium]